MRFIDYILNEENTVTVEVNPEDLRDPAKRRAAQQEQEKKKRQSKSQRLADAREQLRKAQERLRDIQKEQ